MLAVPFVDCTSTVNGHGTIPVVGLGCFYLLQKVDPEGNENFVFGEYIGDCGADGTPGPEPDPEPGGKRRHLQDRPAQRSAEPGLMTRPRTIAAIPRGRAGRAESRPWSSS